MIFLSDNDILSSHVGYFGIFIKRGSQRLHIGRVSLCSLKMSGLVEIESEEQGGRAW